MRILTLVVVCSLAACLDDTPRGEFKAPTVFDVTTVQVELPLQLSGEFLRVTSADGRLLFEGSAALAARNDLRLETLQTEDELKVSLSVGAGAPIETTLAIGANRRAVLDLGAVQ